MVLSIFLSIYTCKFFLGTISGVGRSKIGFWGEKWCKPVKKLCRTDDSSLRRAACEMSSVATGRHSLKRYLLCSRNRRV